MEGDRDVDEIGVERAATTDAEWPGASDALVDALAVATTSEEIESVLRADASGVAASLLDARPAGLAVLAAPAPGTKDSSAENTDEHPGLVGTDVLQLGAGWAMLPLALEHLGARVTVVDATYARLRAAHLLRDPAPFSPKPVAGGGQVMDLVSAEAADGAVGRPSPSGMQPAPTGERSVGVARRAMHLEEDQPLPFADGTFATVFWDRTLTEVPTARAVAERRLAEVVRVTARDGVVVVALRHPVFAAIDRHAGAGRGARVRAALAEVKPADLAAPWAAGLRRAGLRRAALLVPARDVALLPRLMPPDEARSALRRLVPRDARERGRRLAAGAGLVAGLAPRAVLLARRPDSRGVTLAEQLVGAGAELVPRETWRVGVGGARGFAKIGLGPAQSGSIAEEVARTRAAAATELAAVVPDGVTTRAVGSATVAVFSRLPARVVALDEIEGFLAGLLGSLRVTEPAPIATTPLCARIAEPRLPVNVERTSSARLRAWLLAHSDVRVVTGPTHGDLVVDNVMLSGSGRGYLIDWMRFETSSPLLLDPLQAALSLHQRRRGVGLADAVADYVDGGISAPLAQLADRRSGGLSRAEAAAWLLLHEVTALQNPVDVPSARRLADVARLLDDRLLARQDA